MMMNLDELKSVLYGLDNSRKVRAVATIDGEEFVLEVVGACPGPGFDMLTLTLVESPVPLSKDEAWQNIVRVSRLLTLPNVAEEYAYESLEKAINAWKDAL